MSRQRRTRTRCGTVPRATASYSVTTRLSGDSFDAIEQLKTDLADQGLVVSRSAIVRALLVQGHRHLRGNVRRLLGAL